MELEARSLVQRIGVVGLLPWEPASLGSGRGLVREATTPIVPMGRAATAPIASWRPAESARADWALKEAPGSRRQAHGAGAQLFCIARLADELPIHSPTRVADWFRSGGIGLSSKAVSFQTGRSILDPTRTAPSLRAGRSPTQPSLGSTLEARLIKNSVKMHPIL